MRFKIYLTFFFKGRNNFTETYILHYTLPHITWSAFNERVNIAIMLLDVFTELVGGWLNNHNLDKNPSQLSNGKKGSSAGVPFRNFCSGPIHQDNNTCIVLLLQEQHSYGMQK